MSHFSHSFGRVVGLGAVAASLTIGSAPLAALATNASDQPLTRLAGSSGPGTAVAISKDLYADGAADHAVVATRLDFADALGGSVFAARQDAPLLSTGPFGLHPETRDELARVLKNDTGDVDVYLIGGFKALDKKIQQQIEAIRPDITVERIEGMNRADTAAKLAHKLDTLLGTTPESVFVGNGWNYPDLMAAGAIGGNESISANNFPVLLSKHDALPDATVSYLSGNTAVLKNVYVVGGVLGVSDTVFEELKRLLPGVNIERIYGGNRVETAIAMVKK